MAKQLILEFQGVDQDQYNAVNAKLGIDPKTGKGDWPKGLIVHTGGVADDGRMIVSEVWDSQDNQADFMEKRLGPALGEVGVPAPSNVTWVDLYAHHIT